jgi:hypothetical protein
MKGIWLIMGMSLLLFSCGKNIDKKSKEYDVSQIYKVLVDRSSSYNNMKIKVSEILLDKTIDSNSMFLIKKGLRNFNSAIQSSIDDFNAIEETTVFKAGLKSVGAKKYDDIRYQLSKVGFNQSREFAVVYEADSNTPEISHKSFLFFKKTNNEWMIDTEIIE